MPPTPSRPIYKGRKVGNIGDLTCFSFYATKNVVTGEGGMVTTNNPDFADKIKMYGLHGMSRDAWKRFSDDGYKHYQVVFPGFKYNMMDLQAAIGLHQLARVNETLKRRNEIWQIYNQAFADLPVGLPAPDEPDTVHARHLYTLMIDKERCGLTRDEFMQQNASTQHRHGCALCWCPSPSLLPGAFRLHRARFSQRHLDQRTHGLNSIVT